MSLFSTPDSYLIDTHPLSKSTGSSYSLRDQVIVPARIGLDLIAVPQGAELDCDFQLQVIDNGVLLSGTIDTVAQGECARCLNPVHLPVEVQIAELFQEEPEPLRQRGNRSSRAASSQKPTDTQSKDAIDADEFEDEMYYIHDGMIDVEQSIIDAIALSLPLIPLCAENCAGLCVECGLNLNTLSDPEQHVHDTVDPRFAKLQGLLSSMDFKDDESREPLADDLHKFGQ